MIKLLKIVVFFVLHAFDLWDTVVYNDYEMVKSG